MSAQLSAVPEPGDHDIPTIGPKAFLPGEVGDAERDGSPATAAEDAPRPAWWRDRRNQLLGGAAGAALLVAIGLVVVSGGSGTTPVGGIPGIVPGETIVAPAAKVAGVPTGDAPSKAVKPVVTIAPKDQQVREIIGFQQSDGNLTPDGGTPVAPKSAPAAGAAPQPAGPQAVNSATAPIDTNTKAMVASAPGEKSDSTKSQDTPSGRQADTAAQAQAASPAPTAQAPAPDPVAVATSIKAADMTQPQQIEVLALVTELGTLIRDQRAEIAALRTDQEHTASAVDAKLDDFERRLTLAEAKGALDSAMGSAARSVASAAATPTTGPMEKLPRLVRASASSNAPTPLAPDDGASDGPKRYRVQAASPNLAMLAEIDRSGDDGAQLQISIGDTVPGYGKVTRIAQRGTAWVVQTDHGSIQ